MPTLKRLASCCVVVLALCPVLGLRSGWAFQQTDDIAVSTVKPSDADPAIRDFDDPAYVFSPKGVSDSAPLVVFLPGTKGTPNDRPMLRFVAGLGYRVIFLQYDNEPSVNPKCPRSSDPDDCSEHFRADRIQGDSQSTVTQTPAPETIVNRLTKTLQYLDAKSPDDHWGAYLANGEPNWNRLIVSGLSQGAGMAAFIAKEHEVARVVLFSAPADFAYDTSNPDGSHPVAWIGKPGATPPDRWFAEYHERERGAARLRASYAELRIPADQIFVFNLDLPDDEGGGKKNPFHGSTVKNQGYKPQWERMFGSPAN